ncbi:RHS repeat domain-containing protein [Cesiribacter sp. SM1]|uniref:RHS repeat domain-containing protein n=1 Tax=Cesiribacter sp. SM1 TaxID=2861196 RepID=UPI001CD632EB|nr:RHS repeat-associated core domain-containing protein [Cesiribacter sp. SM1]
MILAALSGAPGYTVTVEGAATRIAVNSTGATALLNPLEEEQQPKAFLSWQFLPANGKKLDEDGGFDQVSAAAAISNKTGVGNHEVLEVEYIVKQKGWINLELDMAGADSYEAESRNIDVYFDDFEVAHHHGLIVQEDSYYPFGLTFNEYKMEGTLANKFKYNGKEEQEEWGVIDYGARMYQADLGRWFNVDPLADSSWSFTPYHYVANNPILLVDPDGRDFYIWYENDKGKTVHFRFNGSNAADAPDNKFVQQFITAYNYNVENGGGEKMQAIAGNSDIKIGVAETEFSSQHHLGNIYWNPNAGAEYENGTVVSPATVLEHESDHANQRATNYKQWDNDSRSNKEELRVINGSEQKTAKANGEIPKNGVTRTRHEGKAVITYGPTSNKVNKAATQAHQKRLIERAKKALDQNQ